MVKIYEQVVLEIERQIEIDEIALLSVTEYNAYRDIIPKIESWWWLRTPDVLNDHAAFIDHDGWVKDSNVDDTFGVRPALRIKNPELAYLTTGKKFKLAGYIWTMLENNLALCDVVIKNCAFRKDWSATDANNYEKSDVKKYLEKWATENEIKMETI